MELTISLAIMGVVSYGAIQMYEDTAQNSEKAELKNELLEAAQVIRTTMSCEQTLADENTSGEMCGFNLLKSDGSAIFGADSFTLKDESASCDGDDGTDDPFARGFFRVSNKIELSVQKIRKDGSIVIWARSPKGYQGESISVKGDGIFKSAPLTCNSSLVPSSDCRIGKQVIFLSDRRFQGNWGRGKTDKRSFADKICTEDALASGLEGEYVALINVAGEDNPVNFTDIPGKLYNTDCKVVANDKADFWDGTLNNPFGYLPDGTWKPYNIWTGFDETGIKRTPRNCDSYCFRYGSSSCRNRWHICKRRGYGSSRCNNWSTRSSSGIGVLFGDSSRTNHRSFWNVITTGCDDRKSFLCIKKVP